MATHPVSFANDSVGATPRGWTATFTGTGEARWTVAEEPSAPSRSKIVQQTGRATFPLLLLDGVHIKNGSVETKFKAVAGSEDRAAGLVWRATDARNYYVVRANALEDNVVLYKVASGVRSPLDIVGRKGGYGIKVAVPDNRWLHLRIDFQGSRFKASYDGRQLFEVDDSTFDGAGKIGLWTKADSLTQFDEIAYGETA